MKECVITVTMLINQDDEFATREISADFNTGNQLTKIEGLLFPGELRTFSDLVQLAKQSARANSCR